MTGDYTHTFIVLIIILYFMFSVYMSNALIGSPTAMFELLAQASKARPVAGNQDGSYLTLEANFGLVFGVIQLCSGMGTVFSIKVTGKELSLVGQRLPYGHTSWVVSLGLQFYLGL